MPKTVLFILGSPYCGSTLLSHLLASGPRSVSIGEAQRFRAFGQFESAPAHYLDLCSFCATQERYDCPVWTEEVAERTARDGAARAYAAAIEALDADLVIDSSKEARWLRLVSREPALAQAARLACVVMVRHPAAFARSNAKRVPDKPPHWHVNGWRNIYTFILHSLGRLCVPHVVARYEDLVEAPEAKAAQILAHIAPEAGIDPARMHHRVHHPLGGNLAELARSAGFDPRGFRNLQGAEADFNVRRVAGWIDSGQMEAEKARGVYRSAPRFEAADAELLLEPGVASLCRMLGYSAADLSMQLGTAEPEG